MGKQVKRVISIILTACILCAVVCTQVGGWCRIDYKTVTLTEGDFVVRYDYKHAPETYFYYELTEQAKEKDYLIIPASLNGKTLKILTGDRDSLGKSYTQVVPLNYDGNYKKIYTTGEFNKKDTVYDVEGYTSRYSYRIRALDISNVLIELGTIHKIEKIMFNYFYIFSSEFVTFMSSKVPLLYSNYDFFIDIIKNKEPWRKSADSKAECVYPDIYEKTNGKISLDSTISVYTFLQHFKLANVQFKYNYENCPNYGYYWIDDIENGEKIEVIPEAPIRDGYTFGGWYTEPECISEFDFNTPITKEELGLFEKYKETREITIDNIPDDYVTFLYAKWIEN